MVATKNMPRKNRLSKKFAKALYRTRLEQMLIAINCKSKAQNIKDAAHIKKLQVQLYEYKMSADGLLKDRQQHIIGTLEGQHEELKRQFQILERERDTLACSLDGSDRYICSLYETYFRQRDEEARLRSALFSMKCELERYEAKEAMYRHESIQLRKEISDLRSSLQTMQGTLGAIPVLSRKAELCDKLLGSVQQLKECCKGITEGLQDPIFMDVSESAVWALPCGHFFCEETLAALLVQCKRDTLGQLPGGQMRCPRDCPLCKTIYRDPNTRCLRLFGMEDAVKRSLEMQSVVDDLLMAQVPH